MNPYNDGFSNWKDVQDNFRIDMPEPDEVIIADYELGGYEGSATVIYRNGDKYYQVYGGHCSCYGLEDQWEPTEYSSKEELLAVLKKYKHHNLDVQENIEKAIKELEN